LSSCENVPHPIITLGHNASYRELTLEDVLTMASMSVGALSLRMGSLGLGSSTRYVTRISGHSKASTARMVATATAGSEEAPKKGQQLQGMVLSDKMDKSVVVSVRRVKRHPTLKKIMYRTKKFIAHDEENAYKVGDEVVIQSCRPLSKRKTFKVISKVNN